MFSLAHIPPSHKDCTLGNFDFQKLDYLKKDLSVYCGGEGGLLVTGPPGVGKTHLLVGVYKMLAEELHEGPSGVEIQFWPQLLVKLREGFEQNKIWETTIGQMAQAKFLLLDDVQLIQGFSQKVFSRVILGVYDSGGCLFVTSNHVLEDMFAFLSTHDASRLTDLVKLVRIEGEDRRGG